MMLDSCPWLRLPRAPNSNHYAPPLYGAVEDSPTQQSNNYEEDEGAELGVPPPGADYAAS